MQECDTLRTKLEVKEKELLKLEEKLNERERVSPCTLFVDMNMSSSRFEVCTK